MQSITKRTTYIVNNITQLQCKAKPGSTRPGSSRVWSIACPTELGTSWKVLGKAMLVKKSLRSNLCKFVCWVEVSAFVLVFIISKDWCTNMWSLDVLEYNPSKKQSKYWNMCWNALVETFWPDSLKQQKHWWQVPLGARWATHPSVQYSTLKMYCVRCWVFFYSQTNTFIVSQFITKASMHPNLWGLALDLRNPKVFRARTMMRRLDEWYFYS